MSKKTESKIDSHSKSSQTAYENPDNESINQQQLDLTNPIVRNS